MRSPHPSLSALPRQVQTKCPNLSGGVGIPYTPDKEPNDIAVIGEGVRQKFEEIMVPAGLGDVAIFTELGRFMLAPYGALIAKAIHEKHIYKEYIGLNVIWLLIRCVRNANSTR